MGNMSSSKHFRFQGVLTGDNVEYHSGLGIPTELGGAAALALSLAPQGSDYIDTLSGKRYVKRSNTGVVATDWIYQLNQTDFASLTNQINSGGTLANAVRDAVGLETDGSLDDTAFLGSNYFKTEITITDALLAVDAQVKVNTDALVTETAARVAADTAITNSVTAVSTALDAEVARAQTAEQTETDNRVAADTALASSINDQISTEAAARLAGDAAANTRMDGVQAELDATQEAAGLNADGTFPVQSGTAYLDSVTNLVGGLASLDAGLAAEVTRATGQEALLASALANEAQLRADGDAALQNQIQAWVETQIALDNTTDEARVAAEAALRISGDTALQAELDATQAAIGLDTDGNVIPVTGTNYLDGIQSVFGGAFILDTELKRVDNSLSAEITRALDAEASLTALINTANLDRTTADQAIQNELNATQTGAGLETDGSYSAPTGTNYLAGTTSLKNADLALDAAVKVVADAAASNAAAISALSTSSTGAIAAETAARVADVADLQSQLDAEVTRATDAEATATAAVALLDRKQTQTAALLLAARKESKALNVMAATAVDEMSTQQVDAAKWTVLVKGVGADARKRMVMEVVALHNGTADVDADEVDVSAYATLRVGSLPTDLDVTVELVGTGTSQRMVLKVVSPTVAVDVFSVRERLPGLDVDGTDGINNWTLADPNFYFGSQSYTPNPDIVF